MPECVASCFSAAAWVCRSGAGMLTSIFLFNALADLSVDAGIRPPRAALSAGRSRTLCA